MNRKLLIRNIVLALMLVSLIVVIIITAGNTHFGSAEESFTGKSGKEITRIEMTSEGSSLVLSLKNDAWFVNSRYEARPAAISFIKSILSEMRIKSTVSDDMFEKDMEEQQMVPVRVKTMAGGRRNSTFIVYKTRSNSYGNYMKLKAASRPYIMHLPGFNGNIGSVFTVNELYWRPYTIFNLLPSEITSVTVENNIYPNASFSIKNDNGRVDLKTEAEQPFVFDSAAVRRYLSYFTFIPFEQWAQDLTPQEQEIIRGEDPAIVIKAVLTNGRSRELLLWNRTDSVGVVDTDRLWGKTGDNDNLFIVRYFDIDPLLKRLSYFLAR